MIKALALIGGKWHDFETCCGMVRDLLASAGKAKLDLTDDKKVLASPKLKAYDLVVIYAQGGKLTQREEKGICDFVAGGKALLGIHSASAAFKDNKRYIEMLGSTFAGHGPVLEFGVTVCDGDHSITRRVDDFRVTDELYVSEYSPEGLDILMTADWQGTRQPMLYTKPYGKGRVVYFALGHDERAVGHPTFRKVVLRAVDWAMGKEETGTIGCGVIGYGPAFNMGKHHGNFIVGTPGLELRAICDLDPARTEAAKEDFPGVRTYNDIGEAVADDEVDVLTVVTPHNTHYALAMQCLKAGKGVILEKPFCITAKEATDMLKASEKSGALLTVYHNRRLDGDFLAMKWVIDQGLIGDVFHVEAYSGGYREPKPWWRSDKRISGGAMYDWGAHFIDWILNLMPGPIQNVTGFFHKRVWHAVTNEDHCQAIIRFKDGRFAEYQTSSIARVGKARWRILGTKGGIGPGEDCVHVTTELNGVETSFPVKHIASNRAAYYHNIADHLLRGESLMVTPKSARRVIAVIEAAEKSAKSGRPEKIPHEQGT